MKACSVSKSSPSTKLMLSCVVCLPYFNPKRASTLSRPTQHDGPPTRSRESACGCPLRILPLAGPCDGTGRLSCRTCHCQKTWRKEQDAESRVGLRFLQSL